MTRIYELSQDSPELDVTSFYSFFTPLPVYSLRVGHVTLLPYAWDRDSLYIETHNGGFEPERLLLAGAEVSHDNPVSPGCSAGHCLGATEGMVWVGDKDKRLLITTSPQDTYSVPLLRYSEPEGEPLFCRLAYSLAETDDTGHATMQGIITFRQTFRLEVSR